MTRAVMIGNSHVGALKLAWDAMARDHPWLDMDFFAAPAKRFNQFRLLENRRFGAPPDAASRQRQRLTDMSGRESIDLSDADVVIWAGFRWRAAGLGELMKDFDIEGLRKVGASHLMSRAAFDAICAAWAEALTPPPEWRGWTGRRPKLVVLPRTTRSEDCLTTADRSSQIWRTLAQDPRGGREVVLAFFDTFVRTFREQAIEVIPQPSETLLPSGLTGARFSRGSRTLDGSATHGEEGFAHMNADFGRLYLTKVLARLEPA